MPSSSQSALSFTHPLTTAKYRDVLKRVSHIDIHSDSSASSPNWLHILSSPLPSLVHIAIVGIEMSFDLAAEPYKVLPHNGKFLSSCPSLRILIIKSVSVQWDKFSFPHTLQHLTIDYRRHTPAGWGPAGPDLEPGSTIPTLTQLRDALSGLSVLENLYLIGVFESTYLHNDMISSRGIITLPRLRDLSIAGNAAAMNALISTLALPSLVNLHIATPEWHLINTIPSLTDFLRIYHPPHDAIASICIGIPNNSTDNAVRFNLRRASTEPSPELVLQDLGDENSWTQMVVQGSVGTITILVIDDIVPHHNVQPPSCASWHLVSKALPDVMEIWILGGIKWAREITHAVSMFPEVWPCLRLINVDFEPTPDGDDESELNAWLAYTVSIDRGLEIRYKGTAHHRPQ